METKEQPEGILLKPLPAIKPGEVVGEEQHRKLIEELDEMRQRWR